MAVGRTQPGTMAGATGAGRVVARRAFTLIEILFAIAVIFVLIGLLIGGLRMALKGSGKSLDTGVLNGLKMSVEQFKQQVGFLPPLVQDEKGPLDAARKRPLVHDMSDPATIEFLCGRGTGSLNKYGRFSVYSIPFYVVGVLDVDGVKGPGLRAPLSDGSFGTGGRAFDPFFDVGRNAKAIAIDDAAAGKVTLRDRKGVPFRYYRWLRGDKTGAILDPDTDLNVPEILGDPMSNPELKSAEYALVAAGPNGLFGDEDQIPSGYPGYMKIEEMAGKLGISEGTSPEKIRRLAAEDNIVEVGR